ncbi:hypothetical protein CC86DRAFT_371088 [Ophiobolus disseminans]|uniref:Uncharacterized protein n=1 Tax=Ophiobolus disseminans TaxID=1469910 RepID=A0A6A6ZXI7_9PLEO|nr:hypothetical protein CC86DRAFT_371088 [Ophiobolus disseminans]
MPNKNKNQATRYEKSDYGKMMGDEKQLKPDQNLSGIVMTHHYVRLAIRSCARRTESDLHQLKLETR